MTEEQELAARRNAFKAEFVELLNKWNADFRVKNYNRTHPAYPTDLEASITLKKDGYTFDIGGSICSE